MGKQDYLCSQTDALISNSRTLKLDILVFDTQFLTPEQIAPRQTGGGGAFLHSSMLEHHFIHHIAKLLILNVTLKTVTVA